MIFQVTEAAFERMSGPLERIRGFVDLESDWDSYGASRIQPKAVLQAIQLLTKIAQNDVTVPAVVPTSAGGFQLEWHRAQADLELEVQPNGSVRVFLQMPNGQTWEGPLANSQWRLEEFLRQVDRS